MKALIEAIKSSKMEYRPELCILLEERISTLIREKELLEKNPSLGDRTAVDTILEAARREIGGSDINKLAEEIKGLYQIVVKDFQLEQGLEKIGGHIGNLKNLFGLYPKRKSKEDLIGDFYFDEEDLPSSAALQLGGAIENLITLFPEKYLKNVVDVTVFMEKKMDAYSYAQVDSDEVYIFFKDDNAFDKIARLLHEFTHVIETHNPDLQKAVLNFLYNRSSKKTSIRAKEIALRYEKPCPRGIEDLMVLEGKWSQIYKGYIYESENSIATELLSMSMEELFIDPISLLIRDPSLFIFLRDVIQGKRLSKYKLKI